MMNVRGPIVHLLFMGSSIRLFILILIFEMTEDRGILLTLNSFAVMSISNRLPNSVTSMIPHKLKYHEGNFYLSIENGM